jgi:hypothetical protein
MPALPMEKTTLKTRLGSIAVLAAVLALPAMPAQAVVPPGNSAVNQYTESFPTARGAETTKRKGKQKARSPLEALGRDKARKLAAEGPIGREVAEVVAATAPTGATSASGATSADPAPGAAPHSDLAPAGKGPDGSSGFREVIAQATGASDSGRMGILLPLLILAAIAGSAIYFWRQRRQAA